MYKGAEATNDKSFEKWKQLRDLAPFDFATLSDK